MIQEVVITGASGFLGSTLTAHLKAKDFKVLAVSRRAFPGMLQVENYTQVPNADFLVHLAEEADRNKVNQLGEAYVLQAGEVVKALARRFPQKMIYASSGVVYGDSNTVPCRVATLVQSYDTYSRLKLLNEKIVLDAGGAAIRLSNLFGLGMAKNNVISDIVRQIPGEGQLHVRDDMPVRDFLAISEAARAFSLLLEKKYAGLVNVGSGIGTSIRELAKNLLVLAGEFGREIVATHPSARSSVNVLDITETKRLLAWSPSSSLSEQLALFLKRSKENS